MDKFVRRYTSLADGLDCLISETIPLGEYEHWEDRNERANLEAYEKSKGLKEYSLRITCFTQSSETSHHWSQYAKTGLCFSLKKEAILRQAKAKSLKCKEVEYVDVKNIGTKTDPDSWPFIKRHPFADEKEFRLISDHGDEALELTPELIETIWISPWLREFSRNNIKTLLQGIGWIAESKIPIYKTTLLENPRWVNHFQNAN